LLPKQE
jgi:hypothetical protein